MPLFVSFPWVTQNAVFQRSLFLSNKMQNFMSSLLAVFSCVKGKNNNNLGAALSAYLVKKTKVKHLKCKGQWLSPEIHIYASKWIARFWECLSDLNSEPDLAQHLSKPSLLFQSQARFRCQVPQLEKFNSNLLSGTLIHFNVANDKWRFCYLENTSKAATLCPCAKLKSYRSALLKRVVRDGKER